MHRTDLVPPRPDPTAMAGVRRGAPERIVAVANGDPPAPLSLPESSLRSCEPRLTMSGD